MKDSPMERLKINLPPTLIEQYRLYAEEEFNGTVTKKKLIAYIKRDYVPTKVVNRGTAWQLMIENGLEQYADPERNQYVVKDKSLKGAVVFSFDQVHTLKRFSKAYPKMMHEVSHSLWLSDEDYLIRVGMKIDGINYLELHENKTCVKPPTYDKYYYSVQWRCYLLALPEAIQICYNVWDFNTEGQVGFNRYTFMRDHDLEAYVMKYVDGLIHFLEVNKLLQYVQPEWLQKYKPFF